MNSILGPCTKCGDHLNPCRCALEADLHDLRLYKEDIEQTHRMVMEEKCPTDEVHCCCVPILRREIAGLSLTLDFVSSNITLMDRSGVFKNNALDIKIVKSIREAITKAMNKDR